MKKIVCGGFNIFIYDLSLNFQLTLIEGVINDVAVSHVSDLKRIPVQHPTHPTFSALPRLQEALNMYSTEDFGAPKLLRPFKGTNILVEL